MAKAGGGASSIISLPQGGGALQGIGEKFSPDLHTGTGNFTVPIALPPGRNGFQPRLNLVYSTGNGNGLFGLGWNLNIPGVTRKTSHGVPRYNDKPFDDVDNDGVPEDIFLLSGAEDLVPLSWGGDYPPNRREYRPRTEGLFAKIERQLDKENDYWEVKTKDGLISLYGTPGTRGNDSAIIEKLSSPANANAAKVFAWKLTETRDPFGNLIRYQYARDSGRIPAAHPAVFEHEWNQPLLQRILYADYGDPARPNFLVSVTFQYDDRFDPFSDYRAGFEMRTSKRCSKITIKTHAGQDWPVREYRFIYDNSAANGVSLLKQIEIVGFDDLGKPSPPELPPLEFGYTRFEPQRRKFDPVVGEDLPARALSNAFMELVDLHGAGLPDLLEMNGTVRYWRNLGGGQFDLPRPMREAPPHALSDPGVQLLDANGDGRLDLMVTTGELAGFYPLKFDPVRPQWDAKSFQPFKQAPSFNLADPEVKLIDLDGDGITDVVRSGSRFECFFNSAEARRAWERFTPVERKSQETFPNISFSDPRVKLADMNGDGLQDIVLVYDANVEYWSNLGHGQWGPRIHLRNSPRLPFGYDPQHVLVGDVDGDGLADLVYVDDGKVCLWINQSGNAWNGPTVIQGTPRANNLTTVRLVDLKGTGTAGVLWSADAGVNGNPHLFFLDLTGGVKPYLLNEMNNHMGATTKVEYSPSTQFFLQDLRNPKTRWKTPLPFPVQVVSRMEVIDDISKGKLTTEYKYHHGYWDGAEREFHGFGMVEQLDTETFENYNTPGLHGNTTLFAKVEGQGRFSPPTLTKTWFHQGAVGDEYGDWSELDLTNEYWEGDPQLLDHTKAVNEFLKQGIKAPSGPSLSGTTLKLSRRAKRDALRALRGSILRTELYALDGDKQRESRHALDGDKQRESRPYTVTEYSYGLTEVEPPRDPITQRRRIFSPQRTVQRITQWERGDDPMTMFTFTTDYDHFGQPRQQTTVALPRYSANRVQWTGAVNRQVSPDETVILATHTRTKYAAPTGGAYLQDRVCETKSFELAQPPQFSDGSIAPLQALLKKQFDEAKRVHGQFVTLGPGEVHLIGHTLNYYDGEPFVGLSHAQVGTYGALTRSETLVFRDEELKDAYADGNATRRPSYLDGPAGLPNGAPAGFGLDLGYRRTNTDGLHEAGYYADTIRQQFDFQVQTSREKRGVVLAQQDARGNRTDITPDLYWLLPESVTDAVGLRTQATYNYRVLQPSSVTDPNGNVTEFTFSPIGLLTEIWVKGQPTKNEGDRQRPSVKLKYDFLAYRDMESVPSARRAPIFVHTTRHVYHDTDTGIPQAQRDEVIESYEYSDGFGRLIQTRTQAEEWIFGDNGDDVGLPALQDNPSQPAVARRVKDRVVVSGWQIYDNKGRVVEKYEPFFDKGWSFQREDDAKRGVFAQMFYDPRGQVIRTVNPDGSEQRVIFGVPGSIANPDVTKPTGFEPTPWERYTYDPNDLSPLTLSPLTHSGSAGVPAAHHFTPASVVLDAMGRARCVVARNGADPAKDWFITCSTYDIRGNLLAVNDALGRDAFKHAYDLLNRPLRVESIDAGLRTSVPDAVGNLVEYRDSKGSVVLREYDRLNRLTKLWARNTLNDRLTLREHIIYGDVGDRANAQAHNQLGKPVEHRDEAGVLRFAEYDFKGNLLDKTRLVISDAALANGWQPDWDAPTAEQALESTEYRTTTSYDALNRPGSVTYPADVNGHRAVLKPMYNRAAALEKVQLDDAVYVERIAYNARGQRVLITYGNNLMTRYAYDRQTFCLARLRTEAIASPGLLGRIAAFFTGSTGDEITLQPGGKVLQDFAYTYDLVGNIRAIDERVSNCGIANSQFGRDRLLRQFEYDPMYRLTYADGRACKDIGVPRPLQDLPRCGFYAGGAPTPNQDNAPDLTEQYSETYSYDPAGNMLELTHQAGRNTWKRVFGMGDFPPDQWASAPNNRLTSLINGSQNHPYQFDNNGNLIQQDTEKHHTWDHADRMIGYHVQPTQTSPNSLEARYLYGADGMRVKKWVRKSNGATHDESTVYIDGIFEHHRWAESGTAKQNNHLHVMDNQGRIAIVRVGDKYPDDGGEKVQYHLGDHLGSSAIVVGGDNSTVSAFINREEYFPYGETSFGSFAKKRYRFSRKERDEESGLYYYGARYFNVVLSKWISCDSPSMTDENNLYCFCALSPITFFDSLGNKPVASKSRAFDIAPEEAEVQMSLENGLSIDLEGRERANTAIEYQRSHNDLEYKQVSDSTPDDKYIDCSEFAKIVAEKQGYLPGRTSRDQAKFYQESGSWTTDVTEIRIGDFLFWKSPKEEEISHTGVVIGFDNKANARVLNAEINKNKPGSLKEAILDSEGWIWGKNKGKELVGIGRPLSDQPSPDMSIGLPATGNPQKTKSAPSPAPGSKSVEALPDDEVMLRLMDIKPGPRIDIDHLPTG